MKNLLWLVVVSGFVLLAGWTAWYSLRKWKARQLAEEERFASFIAEATGKTGPAGPLPPPTPALAPADLPAAGNGLAVQKLLFEAAHKAGEAGEPALAIQLYARLLARYPTTTLAVPARAAVETQKKKLPFITG